MATRRYRISPEKATWQVISEPGLPVVSDLIEATVELAPSIGSQTGPSQINREDVIFCLKKIRDWIIEHEWPPPNEGVEAFLLQENGDFLLQENGDKFLL